MPKQRMALIIRRSSAEEVSEMLDACERWSNCEFTVPSSPLEELAKAIEIHFGLNVGGTLGPKEFVMWAEYDDDVDISPVTSICDKNGWPWRTEVQ